MCQYLLILTACCVVQGLLHIDMSVNQIVYCGSPGWCVLTMLLKVSIYMYFCKAKNTSETLSPIVSRAICQFAKGNGIRHSHRHLCSPRQMSA